MLVVRPQPGQAAQGGAQLAQVARACRLQRHSGDDALHIADAAQQVAQTLPGAVVAEGCDGPLTRFENLALA